ncbi:acyltransferase family protein [Methanolacinia petrolearia]|uniref:acyltransferase family protein n=1 Tax=Methanolacinia petrolearia TaxID=54120 RepID=UPI003BADAF63
MDVRYTNNFDFLRFFAAASIIFSHCFALYLGYSNVFLFDWHLLVGQTGLAILLVISGYLITQSWDKKPQLKLFLWKRALRIVPGLIISISMIMLIIGPLNTTFSIQEYFGKLASFSTWLAVPFHTNGWVIGIFTNNPVTYVNAPLWTIPVEFSLYILVALLGVIGILKKRYIMLPFILLTALAWFSFYDSPVLNKIRFAIYFFIGSFLYMNRDKIKFRWGIGLILLIPILLTFGTEYMFIFAFIAIPYFVILVAYVKIPHLSGFGKWGDPSYGMYIYTYPIQQTILNLWPSVEIWQHIALSFGCAIPLAYLSWHLVEKKALALKNIKINFKSKSKSEIA